MLSISLFVSIDLLCDVHQHFFSFSLTHISFPEFQSCFLLLNNNQFHPFQSSFCCSSEMSLLESCDHFIFNHSYSMYLFHCFFCISCSIESDLWWKHWLHLFGEFQFLSHQVLNVSSDVQYRVLSDSLDQFH